MIEFLPPRDGAFGDRDAADFVGLDGDDDAAWGDDEPPRSRWLTALAVLGVTGLLAGGVIAAAPWDATDTAPPPTTAAPTTTVRTRPPSLSDIATEPTIPRDWPTTPAGWIPTDDSSFQVVYAFSSGEDFVIDASWGTSVAVYSAEAEPSRTSGRWLAIEGFPSGMWNRSIHPSAALTRAGERRVLVATASDGVTTVEVEMFPDTGEAPVRISSFGVGLDTLLTIASTVEFVWNGNTRRLGLDGVTASGALDGLTPLVSDTVLPGFAVDGVPLAVTDLVHQNGRRWASIRVVREVPGQELVSDLLLRRPVDVATLPLDVQGRIDGLARRGLPIELSRSLDGYTLVARTQHTSDTLLVASVDNTTSDVNDLLDVLDSVRPAAATEWEELLVQSANDLLEYPEFVSDDEDVTPLGAGSDWSSTLMQDVFSISGPSSGVWEPFSHGQGPELVEYRSFDVAFLRATTTFPNEARLIVVTQEGAERRRAKLVEISGTGVLAAVVELDPTLPYTVAWVDPDELPVEGPIDAAASQASRTEAAP